MAKTTRPCMLELQTDQEKMSARLKLVLDDNGQSLTPDDLKEWLAGNQVKSGVMMDKIEEMVEHDIYGVAVEVAKGKEAVKGADGYFIFYVDNQEENKGPKELENGAVEYVRTNEYRIVKEGQLLAEYVPATNGEYGFTIENGMRTPTRGKELSPLKGKGFRIEEGQYFATITGKFERTDRDMYITSFLEIHGDIDINYGHINFQGDVSIRGDVRSNLMIRATGDIEIKGHVGNCFIEAGKNLTIQNGVQGKFSGRLKAGGDITSKFFENVRVEAGGDINVKTVLHSQLKAKGKIKVEGRDSLVLGGSLHAIQGMELSEVGNKNEISALLSAGVWPEVLEKSVSLAESIEKVEEELDLLTRSAARMEKMMLKGNNHDAARKHQKIIQVKILKATELKQLQDEKLRNDALIQSGSDSQIIIQNVIYPGNKVEIAGIGTLVKEELKHAKFEVRDGNLEASLLY